MSLLPQQIPPQTAPFGRLDSNGHVIIDKNWWLLLYNIWLNSLATGLDPAQTLLADSGADVMDSDAVSLRLPVSNALTLAQTALLGLEQIVNQSVDSTSSPAFVAVKLGNSLVATPITGLLESDGALAYFTDSDGLRATLQRTLFVQTASVTVANSIVETTLIGSGSGSVTLPANYGQIGRTLLMEAFGFHSATGNPSIRIRVYKGTTVLLDTTAVTSGNSANNLIQIRAQITWRSTTSVFAQGFYQESGGGSNNFEMVNTAGTTVNTTSEALNVTLQWGTAAAGNTVTLTNLTLRECN